MRIILTALEPALANAWQRFCGDLSEVDVHLGSILEVDCDAVVSPANSFGFLDGGLDALYRQFFGAELQIRLQQQILDRHHGELLVGTAEIVETEHKRIPYLIAAPTMRVPVLLVDSVNPYLATRASLLLVRNGFFSSGERQGQPIASQVRRLAFPGMGTGIGGVGFNTCAHQVRAAIEDVLLERYRMPRSWAEASQRHQLLYTDRPRRMQHEAD